MMVAVLRVKATSAMMTGINKRPLLCVTSAKTVCINVKQHKIIFTAMFALLSVGLHSKAGVY